MFIGSIVIWIIGLVILYFVIFTAVKDGINRSVIGKWIEKNYRSIEDKKSFLDSDLDNENKR